MSCVRGQPVPGYSAGCAPQEGQKQGLVGLDIQVQTPDAREFFQELQCDEEKAPFEEQYRRIGFNT